MKSKPCAKNIRDIAVLARVSTPTVSRALHDKRANTMAVVADFKSFPRKPQSIVIPAELIVREWSES